MEKERIRKEIGRLTNEYFKDHAVPRLPVRYGGSIHDKEEAVEMINTVLDGWWVGGKRTEEFERLFSGFMGVRHSIFCNSGSSALMLATDALKLPRRSEIVSPALTFPTTINPAVRHGMRITLVDSDIGTYNINTEKLEQAITAETKALVLPHILGNMSDMKRIMKLVEENELLLLEDCCEAIGSRYGNRMLGSFGDVSTFSLYPSHHITAGGGGIAATDSDEIYKAMLSLKNWGRMYSDVRHIPNPAIIRSDYIQQYTYETIGYNLNATEMQAAMGIVQMRKIKRFEKVRQRNFSALLRFFTGYRDMFLLPRVLNRAKPVWFAFPLTISSARIDREKLMEFLYLKRIESRYILAGNIAKQPAYNGIRFRTIGSLSNADRIFRNSFFIGLYQGMDRDKLSHVKECFSEFLGNA